jgi:hypothetical protein
MRCPCGYVAHLLDFAGDGHVVTVVVVDEQEAIHLDAVLERILVWAAIQ